MAVMRIGRAELRVLDLEESVKYYTEVIGLDEVGRSDGKVYFKAWDEFDHHSLILQEADSPGLDHWLLKWKMKRIYPSLKKRSSNSDVR
ncbi:VOC family protein [Bacillus smithii]|uniref:VOC family protein n=1 Tax=Bacillus smithii TaxID=1479 RepID=UPI0030CA01D2